MSEGGELMAHEIWGRRKLTHIIGKAREGTQAHNHALQSGFDFFF